MCRFSMLVLIVFLGGIPIQAASRLELGIDTGHAHANSARYSPDGKLIVTAGDNAARLWDASTGSELRVFTGHAATVHSAVFSPSGALILTGSEDKTARIWDSATGKQILVINVPEGVFSVAYSPDGHQFATASNDGIARSWNAESGKLVHEFRTKNNGTLTRADTSVAYSPRGDEILTSGFNGTIQLWNAGSGQEIGRLEGHTYAVRSFAFSHDGKLILTGSVDHTSRLWDIGSGRELWHSQAGSAVDAVAFSHDGALVATCAGSRILVLETLTAKVLLQLPTTEYLLETRGSATDVKSAEFSRDDKALLVGGHSWNANATLWDLKGQKVIQTLKSHVEWVRSVAISDDGLRLLTGDAHLWNLTTGKVERQLQWDKNLKRFDVQFTEPIRGNVFNDRASLSPDGRKMAASTSSILQIFDTSTGERLLYFEPATFRDRLNLARRPPVEAVYFFPDGRHVLTIERHYFSPDGKRILSPYEGDFPRAETGGVARVAQVWDATTGERLIAFGSRSNVPIIDEGVEHVAFSPDGKHVLTAGGDKFLHLWDWASGKEILRLEPYWRSPRPGYGSLRSCSNTGSKAGQCFALKLMEDSELRDDTSAIAFSPDGTRVVSGGIGNLRVWDMKSGKPIFRLGVEYPISAVAFSADSRLIATGGWDGVVRLRDPATGREVRCYAGHTGTINDITFYKNGKFIISASDDGTWRIFEVESGQLLATMVSFTDGGWAVVDSQGRFDIDSLDSEVPLHWVVSDDPFRPLSIQIFMRQFYTPRLLARILAGETLPAVPNIADLNRVQPAVSQPTVEPDARHPGTVRVRVRVAQSSEGGRKSGAQDLRVFRDGQLVAYREGSLEDREYVFEGIRLSKKRTADFTAYAFNSDRVKSSTAQVNYARMDTPSPRQTRTFLVNIGVNRSSAAGCDLQYAAADAAALAEVLGKALPGNQGRLLMSNGATPNGASKQAIRQALSEVASQATPDDTFVLSFSGHGYTDQDGSFFLFPSDLKGNCNAVNTDITASAVSTDELTEWLRPIDAGEMVMILDACYAAASVQSGDFKPGPMGSRGLGQLAYDKRIRILAASQSTQSAAETPWLQMGLLSFALAHDGIQAGKADWKPKDGKIWLREWLSYAVDRVPRLYDALREGNTNEFQEAARGVKLPIRKRDYANKGLQTPVLFDFRPGDDQGFALR